MEEKIKFGYRLIDTVDIDHDKYKALHNCLFTLFLSHRALNKK
jgi:hypothetical protein